MSDCAECGMTLDKGDDYHPYAACLMYKACHDAKTVQANLNDVAAIYGRGDEFTALRSENDELRALLVEWRHYGWSADDSFTRRVDEALARGRAG